MKFVVIGGDAAGMSAASRAKRNNPDFEVTVLEQTFDVSYSACGMPYNIADPDRVMDDLVVRDARTFREKQGIDLRTGHRVERIDRVSKTVSGRDSQGRSFQIPYRKLLIATGASPTLPNLPGFQLPGVMTLKRLEDGRRIKAHLDAVKIERAVIVGMGYVGLEMVEALRARNIHVDMVKPGPVFIPWMHRDLASVVQKEVESKGVALHFEQPVERIEPAGGHLKVICPDLELAGGMVLVSTGVEPNSGLASEAGLDLGPSGAVAADEFMRTSDKDIYTAGDCADAFHVVTGQRVWVPLALRANRAGWFVADHLAGKEERIEGIAGTAVFKVFDLQVARTGLSVREAEKAGFDPAEVVVEGRSRAHAHPGATSLWVQMVGDRRTGRLLGTQMVGREGAAHRINAPAVALHLGMTVEAFSRCDLAYAPPFSPVWDPMLTAASLLVKKM
jgi:CoA-dependent NAD(P)H sulfur oxidoreductase